MYEHTNVQACVQDGDLCTRLYLKGDEFSRFPYTKTLRQMGPHLKKLTIENTDIKKIPPRIQELSNLKKLSISNHEMKSSIPHELGFLTNLRKLSLPNNNLSGEIPQELMNLTNLEIFDVSDNKLAGEIPQGVENLIHLNVFDVSYNDKMSGDMPKSLTNRIFTVENFRLSYIGTGIIGEQPPKWTW